MSWKELDEPSDDEKRKLDLQYRDKAQFLVDESAGVERQRRGCNAKFVEELGLRGRSDEDVFAPPWKDKPILITDDTEQGREKSQSVTASSGLKGSTIRLCASQT